MSRRLPTALLAALALASCAGPYGYGYGDGGYGYDDAGAFYGGDVGFIGPYGGGRPYRGGDGHGWHRAPGGRFPSIPGGHPGSQGGGSHGGGSHGGGSHGGGGHGGGHGR